MFWIMQSPSDGCNPNETLNLSVRPDPIAITGDLIACAYLDLWHQRRR